MDEQDYRRHLAEAHRQLLERDVTIREADHEVNQLRKQLQATQAWALELEANIRDLERTRAWRLVTRLRAVSAFARGLIRGRQ